MSLINTPEQTHVYAIHWKHRERFSDETFNTTGDIGIKYAH
jgi:hypothetical protein